MNQILKDLTQKTSFTRTLFFIAGDIALITVAVFLAFWLRFDGDIPPSYFSGIFQATLLLTLVVILPAFHFSRLYSLSWTYVSTKEVFALLKAVTISFLLLGAAIFILRDTVFFAGFPRSVLLISYVLVFVATGGIRLAKRVYLQSVAGGVGKEGIRVLVVGAGDAGEQLVRSMSAGHGEYYPMCFVDDNEQKQGEIIHGVKVVGRIVDIPKVVAGNAIEEMIIALPQAGSDLIKKAVEAGRKAGLQNIKVVPSLTDIVHGEVSMGMVREVKVEDLLGRDAIVLDTDAIAKFIAGKAVFITGAAGSIGSEIARQTAAFKPSQLLLFDQDETGIFRIAEELKRIHPNLSLESIVGDIGDAEKVRILFEKFHPNIVFHAAAYKHVPLMELDPAEAVKNNVLGTKIVAENALRSQVEHFVFISTDKAVNPTSVMGATKRIGEMICETLNQKNHTRFCSVRFGNVLDSRGNVVSVFEEQIRRGGPVRVTHPDMQRYFMTTPEACLLVMQAGAMGKGGEVFVLDMGKPVKIVDLAREMIRLSGFEPDKDIPIVFSEPRPGEKLFEEILTAEEGTIATQNQKIFVAKLSQVKEEQLQHALSELLAVSDREDITRILKELILTYTPQSVVSF